MTKPHFKFGLLAASLACGVLIAGCGNKGGGGVSSTGGGETIATVNGEAVGREALRDYLEATNGENALGQLIDYSLLMQKAKAEGVSVSDAEISAAIDERAKNNTAVADAVKGGGVRLQALRRNVNQELALQKLLTKDVKATEDQLKKWFETRRKYYDQPEKVKIGFLLASTKARAETMAAQLKSKSKSFQDLVLEQQKANDQLGQGSQAENPQMVNTDTLPPALKNSITKLQKGQTSSPINIGQGAQQAFVIVRLIDRQAAVKADYAKMKSQIEMDYKLEQVAKGLNSQNPQNPPFERTLEQVAGVVAQQTGGQQPSLREILNFINQTAAANLSSSLRTAAQVEIKDASYSKVGEGFKASPAAGGADNAASGDAKK